MSIDINNLTTEQKRQLIIALQASIKETQQDDNEFLHEVRETKFNKGFVCPHCEDTHVVRHGTYKGGKQRYRCRNCNATFSDMTNTPMSRTRYPDKWEPFIECMLNGYSLRKSADILGVSFVSLFYWRHKLLDALKKTNNTPFDGIVEMDETYFLYSQKGRKDLIRKSRKRGGVAKKRGLSYEQVCVLIARDRSKHTVSKVSGVCAVETNSVNSIVGSLVSNENVLCSDGWRAYKSYASIKGMKHYILKDTRVIHGIYHIQNVNNYHMRLKKWIDRFNGVASKYLDNYLAWFKFLDNKAFENTQEILIESCLHNTCETNDSIRLSKFRIA